MLKWDTRDATGISEKARTAAAALVAAASAVADNDDSFILIVIGDVVADDAGLVTRPRGYSPSESRWPRTLAKLWWRARSVGRDRSERASRLFRLLPRRSYPPDSAARRPRVL